MIKVYIASPYTLGNKEKNVMAQREMASRLIDLGYNPMWPLSSHYLDVCHKRDYKTWMKIDYDWLEACDCVLRLPGASKGADMEVERAKERGIDVYTDLDDLLLGMPPYQESFAIKQHLVDFAIVAIEQCARKGLVTEGQIKNDLDHILNRDFVPKIIESVRMMESI